MSTVSEGSSGEKFSQDGTPCTIVLLFKQEVLVYSKVSTLEGVGHCAFGAVRPSHGVPSAIEQSILTPISHGPAGSGVGAGVSTGIFVGGKVRLKLASDPCWRKRSQYP
jgi:hypothetical protein